MINTNKPKPLRKLIQQHFRKYAVLGDLECMFKFFEILKSVYRFDQERYRCALGSGWSIPVELVIGPHQGISYMTDSAVQVRARASILLVSACILMKLVMLAKNGLANGKMLNPVKLKPQFVETGLPTTEVCSGFLVTPDPPCTL